MSKNKTVYPGPFVGKRLRLARLRKLWTQEQLAKKVGVSRVSIARWEAGTHEPSPLSRVRLDHVLRGTVLL